MATTKNYGIIDIGSNTVRLVVYQVDENWNISELQNVKLPIRLYQYLNKKNELTQKGIDQLVEVVALFQQITQHYELESLIATATAVIRQAQNNKEIIATVQAQTGIALRLLSEQEEAFYGQYAIARTMAISEAYSVDMGGGSTEITYFKDNEIVQSHSFPFGVVALKQLFFQDKDHNDPAAIKATRSFVKEQFASLDWLIPRDIPIIAIGGSSRNIATVHERLTDFPVVGIHQYEMDEADLKQTLDLFKTLSLADLQSLDGLSKDRADIIIPANLTFIALMQQVVAPEFIFGNKGLREGLLLEQITDQAPAAYDPVHVADLSVARFVATYQADAKRAKSRTQLLDLLLNELMINQLGPDVMRDLLSYLYYASQLYLSGSAIEEDDSPFHTFYLIANSNLNGFSHKERIALALIASFKNKSLFKLFATPFEKWFSEAELKLIRLAGGLLKFTEAMNITAVNPVRSFALIPKKKELLLKIEWGFDPSAETYQANRQKKHLENVVEKNVILDFSQSPRLEC